MPLAVCRVHSSASLTISTGRPTGAFLLHHSTPEVPPFRDSFLDSIRHDTTSLPTTVYAPVPRTLPPPVPADAPLIPLVDDSPDIYSNVATTLPHPMDAEVDHDGFDEDGPAEPASHSDDLDLPAASGSDTPTTDASAETLAGPVPAVYSAELTPTQGRRYLQRFTGI